VEGGRVEGGRVEGGCQEDDCHHLWAEGGRVEGGRVREEGRRDCRSSEEGCQEEGWRKGVILLPSSKHESE
jgi:hypothetical protein